MRVCCSLHVEFDDQKPQCWVHWGPGLSVSGRCGGVFCALCESVIQLCFAYGHIKMWWTTWSLLLASC
jgi:hypothetical protein